MKKVITMIAIAAVSLGSVYAGVPTMKTDTTTKTKKDTVTKKTPPANRLKK